MDWPAIRKPFLTETFLGKFKYEKDPEFKSKALQLTVRSPIIAILKLPDCSKS